MREYDALVGIWNFNAAHIKIWSNTKVLYADRYGRLLNVLAKVVKVDALMLLQNFLQVYYRKINASCKKKVTESAHVYG